MSEKIAWVECIAPEQAQGKLAETYSSLMDENDEVGNLYIAMSQIPEVIGPAHHHYLALLHNPQSSLEPWLGELIATYVAILCDSEYAYHCHSRNFHCRYGNRKDSETIVRMLKDGRWQSLLKNRRMHAVLSYTEKLTRYPSDMSKDDIEQLRRFDFDDQQISYIVQLASSFAYWARVINGLGIKLEDKFVSS